jgi:hypothetical protein
VAPRNDRYTLARDAEPPKRPCSRASRCGILE